MTKEPFFDPDLFPIPDSHYNRESIFDFKTRMLSLVALSIQLSTSSGNLLGEKGAAKGHVFYRDSGVPLPRPCTIPALDSILRIGATSSPFFVVPFLPSLREEDETGVSIERGARVHSLSRRSGLHIRDENGRIQWGSVFVANRVAPSDPVAHILSRSDIAEALILPRSVIHADSSQLPLRHRMEFLAQHGFPSIREWMIQMGMPAIYRALFQFLSEEVVMAWSRTYGEVWSLVEKDRGQIDSDYQEMIQSLKSTNQEQAVNEAVTKVKNSKKGHLGGFDLAF